MKDAAELKSLNFRRETIDAAQLCYGSDVTAERHYFKIKVQYLIGKLNTLDEPRFVKKQNKPTKNPKQTIDHFTQRVVLEKLHTGLD